MNKSHNKSLVGTLRRDAACAPQLSRYVPLSLGYAISHTEELPSKGGRGAFYLCSRLFVRI